MIASLVRHGQVIKVSLEIYEDVFSYRKFRRQDPGFVGEGVEGVRKQE